MSQGKLYLVATPIGNLEDITLRALRVLREVDLVACEDTRRTLKLLNHFGIRTPRESYHEHNEAERTPRLLELLRAGKSLALVSDAGMPLISDPGFRLVTECARYEVPVIPLPGPSAVLTALAGSALPADSFLFAGFLPPKKTERRKRLAAIAECSCTLVFYEAPHRLSASLEDMAEILGPRKACLARELTKIHEEFLHGTLAQILDVLKARPAIQGEITLVVAGGEGQAQPPANQCPIERQLEEELKNTGASLKEALRAVARRRGISRREAYRQLLVAKKQMPDK